MGLCVGTRYQCKGIIPEGEYIQVCTKKQKGSDFGRVCRVILEQFFLFLLDLFCVLGADGIVVSF